MPFDGKEWVPGVRAQRRPRRVPKVRLAMPVIGMEAEFNVLLDGVEIDPRAYWGHPLAFIQGALLPREIAEDPSERRRESPRYAFEERRRGDRRGWPDAGDLADLVRERGPEEHD